MNPKDSVLTYLHLEATCAHDLSTTTPAQKSNPDPGKGVGVPFRAEDLKSPMPKSR